MENFLGNWEFFCVGVWDGFYVYVSIKFKNFYSYKKRYLVINMGFIGYNKCFMWVVVGVLGFIYDFRFLRSCGIYFDIEFGYVFFNRFLNFDFYGEILFIIVGDLVFFNYFWFLKLYKDGIRVFK